MSRDAAIHPVERLSALVRDGGDLSLNAPIARSWKRCLDYGIDPVQPHRNVLVEGRCLREARERLGDVLESALREMNVLYERIAGSGSIVLLTDYEGLIIDSVTDTDLAEHFTRAGLCRGAVWSEVCEGTNAIGACLLEQRPSIVHLDEHFRVRNKPLTCSASPIFDPTGRLLAVLDVSAINAPESRQSQIHTLALTTLAAQMIEDGYFLRLFQQVWILHFHSRLESLPLQGAGLLAVDGDGRILAANRRAMQQLDLLKPVGQPISTIFDSGLDQLIDHARRQPGGFCPVHDRHGRQYYMLLRSPVQPVSVAKPAAPIEPVQASDAMTLDGIQAGGDPVMRHNVACARRVMNKDLNILLLGETGSGKEIFARAIHQASERAAKPFVALNCASLPESLIESELFGYKHGAFTGARREGMRGKLLQASGGTLFLDEIGDMPLTLQIRLLRVLEDKEVAPLGSETSLPVELHVISATHHNLQEKVAAGEFREDLYYRLNGITLQLPPLRARADRGLLIHAVLAAEAGAVPMRLNEDALAALDRYTWPGNIRQLRNVLRAAVALCEENVIQLENLPPEIARLPSRDTAQTNRLNEDRPKSDQEKSEKETLLRVLNEQHWHISNTAKFLGLSRNTLYRKLRKLGIQEPSHA
ncbi:MAG TPA: sigma-54-dependent Fis family transcriptional regulator [Candidatus Competibacteraceae bacterium]|nr:sigma-54-dependent Fis family transcriptional regulator [Candidatus Competibacteraceae bacterium]